MDNQIQNIEQAIREKFENFSPAPPPQIWDGIIKGVSAAQPKPSFFATYAKPIAAAATVLILAGLGLWWLLSDPVEKDIISDSSDIEVINELKSEDQFPINPVDDQPSKSEELTTATVSDDTDLTRNENQEENVNIEPGKQILSNNDPVNSNIQTEQFNFDDELANEKTEKQVFVEGVPFSDDGYPDFKAGIQNLSKQSTTTISSLIPISLSASSLNQSVFIEKSPEATEIVFSNSPLKANSKWSSGVYFTTEFMLNDFDSVQLLPSYSLNYEPTYQFSNHFFLRFGLGLSYARDRGFAKVDFIRNEVVGTYEDVYDITFDSIDGELVPTYYTKTREIWDSVQHLQVTQVTNKYLYLQTPVLFGYRKSEAKFNWYVYGGPAFNLMVSKQIEEPQDDLQGVDIIDLDNNLPDRSSYYMQLWLGAGIEYKVGRQTAICLEPNYRYYFNTVYENEPYKTALSSFSLRFGVVITMK